MAPGGATRRPLAVQTATAEERGVTPSTAGQDDGGGPNPTSGSLQLEGTREERSGISLRRQITTGTWNVQGMTQGRMTVVEREMERCGLAVIGIAETLVARPGKIQHCRRKHDYVFREGDWEKKCRCGIYGQQRDIKGSPRIQPSE